MALFNSGAKSDVKLGFYLGIGLLLLGFVVSIVQLLIGKVRG